MGLWDQLVDTFNTTWSRWKREAATKAATVAADAAKDRAARAFEAAAEDFVGFAERELERAKGERGADAEADKDDVPAVSQPPPAPRVTAAEREARAREELARLKAERGDGRKSGG